MNTAQPTAETQALADIVNAALETRETALAKLHTVVLTAGTIENPHHSVRNVGGVVYGSWTVVPSKPGWHRWTSLGFGSREDVLAYNDAADAVDVAVKNLLACSQMRAA